MSRKLADQFKKENSSYDRHHEITKSEAHGTLKSYRKHHKHGNCGNTSEEDEMVKYMSNLPGYLERGRKNREKALNVGVLDWSRLEHWQYIHKHVPHRTSRSSTSSNASSSVSTDGLSGHCSRGNSCGPSGQRMNHPSLQSHFTASQMQGHQTRTIKSSREGVGNCPNPRGSNSSTVTQSRNLSADDYLSQNHPNRRLKGYSRTYLDRYIDKESGFFPNDLMYVPASCGRMGIHTQGGGLEKGVETSRRPSIDTVVRSSTLRKSEPVVLHLPRDNQPENSHCRVPDTRTTLVQKSEYYSRMSFSEKPKEFFCKDLDHDFSRSGSIPDELSCNHSQCQESGCSSTDLESIKVPASTFSSPLSTFSSPLSAKMTSSPSRGRKTEEQKPTIGTISSANEPLQVSKPKVTSEKPRSSSPFRRLSVSIGGYASKGNACKESGYVSHPNSVAAPKSNSEVVRGYATSNTSGSEKPGDAARRRSSPLRRLLDPLLKPKTAKICHSIESSQKDTLLVKNCNSVSGNFSGQKTDEEVVRDLRGGCSSATTVDSTKDKKHVPSMTQALLRIAVKNGLPLFTFSVHNTDSNILAATVKNLSASGKDDCNCMYTFFNVRETKKKNGSWMNQAGRSKGPDYISHVVAQMKVLDSLCYDLTGRNCVDSSTMKEFVLLSVKLGQGDAQEDYQPNDELAAIVVKIPKATSFIDDRHRSSYLSENQDLVDATVLLPGGVHTLPSKGGPSSLIERWKTGGSCDCGGWDLGCKLKILTSENQACRKPRSSKAYFTDQLKLFLQGNEQEHRPAFSVTPFKHGMYSVAFDSSLSQLEAFATCIALLDTKMPYELSGSRSSTEEKNPRETLLVPSEELKAFDKLEDIPASYVSYPPHSPVGRV